MPPAAAPASLMVTEWPRRAGGGVGGGGAQPCAPRPYHQHPLTRQRRCDGNLPALAERLVAEEPLDRVDANRRVQLGPVARGLARPVADPAHDGRERVVLHDLPPGGLVLRRAFLGVVQPLLDVLTGGGGGGGRRPAVGVDGAFGPPGAGVVGPARPHVQGYRERLAHGGHGAALPRLMAVAGAGDPPRSLSGDISPKRRMLRSAAAW